MKSHASFNQSAICDDDRIVAAVMLRGEVGLKEGKEMKNLMIKCARKLFKVKGPLKKVVKTASFASVRNLWSRGGRGGEVEGSAKGGEGVPAVHVRGNTWRPGSPRWGVKGRL